MKTETVVVPFMDIRKIQDFYISHQFPQTDGKRSRR